MSETPTPIFSDKSQSPTVQQLEEVLGGNITLWMELEAYVKQQYPKALAEWNFPGAKYGWNFRIKDSKRAIVYLLPRHGFFMVAFVFGGKATASILESPIADSIKTELQQARVYAEGRGISLQVHNESLMDDIKQLVKVKLAF